MGRKSVRKLTDFVNSLVAASAAEIEAAGLTTGAHAVEVAQQIANRICIEHARTEFYVPAEPELFLGPRDQAIWDAYCQPSPGARACTQERLAELSVQYQLTVRHLYSIVALMRRRELASRQGQLQLSPDS